LRYVPRTAAGAGSPGAEDICFTGCLLEELRRLLATVVVLEFASQAVCWRSCAVCRQRWWFWNLLHRLFVGGVAPSVGEGGGFGISFTGCLLEELRCLLATVGFWNLLHGLFVGGEAEE